MIHGTRRVGAALAALALAFVVDVPAFAGDATPSPSASQTVRAATSLVYNAAVTNRDLTMMAINEAFTKAVKRAKKELSAALAKSTTPALKSAAVARFKDAIDRASAIRQAAIDSLPSLPPAPAGKSASK